MYFSMNLPKHFASKASGSQPLCSMDHDRPDLPTQD
jgi:hypothetical protein